MTGKQFKNQNLPSESIILGLMEFSSIATGIKSLDAMVKSAPIKILSAQTISPGHYLTLFTGEVASVEEAVKKGSEIGENYVVDFHVFPNLHSQIIPAITNSNKSHQLKAMGIIETRTVVSAIISADIACKTTEVWLIELRLANGLGGKSFFIFTGELYSVESSMEKAIDSIRLKNTLLNSVIIPSPHKDMNFFFNLTFGIFLLIISIIITKKLVLEKIWHMVI